MDGAARVLMERSALLAGISEEPGLLVRRSLTPAMALVNDVVANWMRAAGMQVRRDAVCNLIGRYEGVSPGAPALILGSHLDTVRDAGPFDGPLGVLAGIACVERLREEDRRLPFAVEVIAFTDEEGLRFPSYLGSSAIAGVFDPAWLDSTDADGVSLRAALRAAGGDPEAIASCRYQPETVIGYCEAHIEQGPVLEAENLPAGVVRAIAGQDRVAVTFSGMAGHAGTVPMALRHDALCAAADFILQVEQLGRETEHLMATVGQIEATPGASNVIPGRVTLSLDIRHQDDAIRLAAIAALRGQAQRIAVARGMTLEWRTGQSSPAVPCAPALVAALGRAIAACGYPVRELTSGAGHDAVPMSRLTQAAMLFVRCKGGVSHNPAESITEEDAGTAIDVLHRFVLDLGAR